MSSIDEIKARIDIVDLVRETVDIRRSGKNYTGFCPFHPNTRTPAFVVFPETGTWRCFGQCNEGGDIFGFVMKKEGWDFSETLKYLADRAGIQLRPPTEEEKAAAEENEGLREILEEALVFYSHQLRNSPRGLETLDYLHNERNLTDQTIEAFGLGYAPDSWESTLQHFRQKGYQNPDLLACGLASERDTGGLYDRFRNRLMFPIRDARSRMAGFGARILDPEDVPKFLNSPQTVVFDKSRLLYGLDRARRAIRMQEQVTIVEGYLDVIALHQAGFTNTVSPMGTALTEHHLFLIKKYTQHIILALDPDAAGEEATIRGLDIARATLDRERDPVFDPRGLVRHEARLKADIRVTMLPQGLDPDEIVHRDPEEWRRILDNARPIVIHVMETLAAKRDLDDPKVKTEIAARVFPLIEDLPNPIERDTYRQRLARLLHIDERTLLEFHPLKAPARRRRNYPTLEPDRESATHTAATSSHSLEAHCLGVLLRRPELLYQVDRRLQEAGLARLSARDFQHADHKTIMRLFQESVNQDIGEPLNYIFNSLSLPMMELADDLLERTGKLNPDDERVQEDLMRGLLELRTRNLRQDIEYLRYLMEDAQADGDPKATGYMQKMLQHTDDLKRLNFALADYTSRAATHRQRGI
jgi:DNA primase